MSPHIRESRLTRVALRNAFPQASPNAIKRASLAALYGATPGQIALIFREDAKLRAVDLVVKK